MANNRRGVPGRTLDFQYPSMSNTRGEPPDKRRRVESNQGRSAAADVGDDLWDDDLDFMTQDQLANIDHEITMSQVPQQDETQAARAAVSTRMVGRGTPRSHSEGNVLSNSVKVNTAHPTNLQPKNVSKLSTKYAKSNSSTNPQVPFTKNENQTGSFGQQPMASGVKTTAQQSSSNRLGPPLKPHGVSSSMLKNQLTPLTGSTGSAQFSPGLPSGQARTADFSQVTQQHIQRLQKELATIKEEYEKSKKLKCQKEGEVNMLRNDLKVTKQELCNTKQEQVKMRDQYKMEQTEKEKTLTQDIERLKTQIQFAERDRDELQTRCKLLEKRGSAAAAGSDGMNSPLVGQAQSPQRRQLQGNQSPATPKGPFPNRVTFMAEESKGVTMSPRRKSVTEETAGRSSEVPQPPKPDWQKKFSVGILNKRGRISGPSLVSLLLPQSTSNNISQQGLVGLLQVPQTKSSVLPSTTPKEEDGSVATNTNRWIQELHQQASSQEYDQPSLVVPHNYYSLAVQAVTTLLQSDPPSSSDDSPLLQGHTEEAVFLLPSIESYLNLYVDQLRAAREPSASMSSTSMTSLSSSLESYDSFSSHQRSLAREIANYTHQVEQWALNALNILSVLVDFSLRVRLAVFGETERSMPKTTTTSDGQEEKNSEEGSSDESLANSTSSVASSKSALRIACKCRILELLICMVNPVLPNNKTSCTDVIEVSLQILATLASKAATAQLLRFGPLVRQDKLQICLEDLSCPAEQRLRCHLCVLDLVKSLSQSADMLALICSSSEDCLLYTMYLAVNTSPQASCPDYRTRFGLKLIQLLSSALSNHTAWMTTILESDCHCSCEVIRMLIQLLHHGLHAYRSTPSVDGLLLLQEGALLMAVLAQYGRIFTQQRRESEIMYIEVVIGLHVIFKDSPDSADYDEVIQTLWDFDVEYSPNTDDSDEAMDVT